MKPGTFVVLLLLLAGTAQAQIQVGLKLHRLQYVSYEPIVATLTVTNLAGRDVELRDGGGQHWFGFEISSRDGQPIAPVTDQAGPPLKIESGKTVTRKVDLAPLYPVHDLGNYRVRANVFFADLNKYFYSQPKIFQITKAHTIWRKTVGVPEGMDGAGETRTYSLMTNRFADHTSLYVRVENKDSGAVYAAYSLGRILSMDEPQAEIDRANQLHVLHCVAPRTWAYAHIGLDGALLKKDRLLEAKTRPRLLHTANGAIAIRGGMQATAVARNIRPNVPKLSARPASAPDDGDPR